MAGKDITKVKLRRMVRINNDIRKIIDADQDDYSLRDVIEKDNKVQEALQNFLINQGEVIEPDANHKGRQIGVPNVLNEERNRRIVDLYNSGITTKTILYNINEQAKKHGWGTLEAERSIRRIICDYYANIRQTKNTDSEEEALREAALARQEKTIEKMSMELQNSDKWKDKFKHCLIMDKLIQAQQLHIENRGRNKSRPTLANNKQTNNFIFLNQNAQEIAMTPVDEMTQQMLADLDQILDND